MCLFCFSAKKQWFIKELGNIEEKPQPATTTRALKSRKLCFSKENGSCSWTTIMAAFSEARRHCWTGWRAQKFSWITGLCCSSSSQKAARGKAKRQLLNPGERKKCPRGIGPAGRSLALKWWIRELQYRATAMVNTMKGATGLEREVEEERWWPAVRIGLQLPLAAQLRFLCWGHASLYQ